MQISYWAKTGKVALENPELPISFVRDVLIAKEQQTKNHKPSFSGFA